MYLQHSTDLCNELDDLDEDVERGVFWDDDLCTLWEETADDTLQSTGCRSVALALHSYHVNPGIIFTHPTYTRRQPASLVLRYYEY